MRHSVISYEEIASAVSSEQTERAKHRAALVLRAIEQASKSYTLAPVAEVRSLWQKIFDIASVEFSDLGMKPPSDKGAQSKWIVFKADLPSKVTIDWKITAPSIDLSFWPAAALRPVDDIDLSALPNARREMSGRTTVIRLLGPRPPATWTEMTDEHIREGLSGALRLLRFFRSNKELFVEISS